MTHRVYCVQPSGAIDPLGSYPEEGEANRACRRGQAGTHEQLGLFAPAATSAPPPPDAPPLPHVPLAAIPGPVWTEPVHPSLAEVTARIATLAPTVAAEGWSDEGALVAQFAARVLHDIEVHGDVSPETGRDLRGPRRLASSLAASALLTALREVHRHTSDPRERHALLRAGVALGHVERWCGQMPASSMRR